MPRYYHNYLRFGVFGDTLRIDASTICQLKCPSCSQATGHSLGRGYLAPELFNRVLELNPWVKQVELSNKGEPLLNPRFHELMDICINKGIVVVLNNGVNLNHISREVLERITAIRSMVISIDGVDQESYSRYRVGGSFDTVVKNIRQVVRARGKSPCPRVFWKFIRMQHNIGLAEKARNMATGLGIGFRTTNDIIDPKLQPKRLVPKQYCYQLWTSPQVNWDGRVYGCCVNTWHPVGDASARPIARIMKTEPYRRMKRASRKPIRDSACYKCRYGPVRRKANF